MKLEEVKNIFGNEILAINAKYDYIKLSEEKKDNFLKNVLSKLPNGASENDYKKNIIWSYTLEIDNYITEALNSNNALEICEDFINSNEVLNDFALLIEFCSFLEKYSFERNDIKKFTKNSDLVKEVIQIAFRNQDTIRELDDDYMKVFLSLNGDSKSAETVLDEELDEEFENDISAMSSVSFYFSEINQMTTPTALENLEMLIDYNLAEGEKKQIIKNKIIESNLKLVVYTVKHYQYRGLELLDLIQEGNIALMSAIENFNVDYSVNFSTYAVVSIKSRIFNALRDLGSSIRVTAYHQEMITKVDNAKSKFAIENFRQPSIEELMRLTNISYKKLLELEMCKTISGSTRSLNDVIKEDESEEIIQFVADETDGPEELYIENEKQEIILNFFKKSNLNDRAKEILSLRTGLVDGICYSLEDIAKRLGLTRERVRQIEAKSLLFLRSADNIDDLGSLIDSDVKEKNAIDMKKINYSMTVYEEFHPFSKHVIDRVLKYLSTKYSEELLIRYGSDYSVPYQNNEVDVKSLKKVSRRIKNLIYNTLNDYELNPENFEKKIVQDRLTVYEDFPNYSKTDVEYILKYLKRSPYYEQKINNIYGSDLSIIQKEKKISENDYRNLKEVIEKHLKGYKVNSKLYHYNDVRIYRSRTLKVYDEFSDFEKNEVDKALEYLLEFEFYNEIITYRYGTDFNKEYKSPDFKSSEYKDIKNLVTLLIRNKLKNSESLINKNDFKTVYGYQKLTTIYEDFAEHKKSDIMNVVEMLKGDNEELIRKRYGTNFDERLDYKAYKNTKYDETEIFNLIKYHLDCLKINDKNYLDKNIYQIYSNYDKKIIDLVINYLSLDEVYKNQIEIFNNASSETKKEFIDIRLSLYKLISQHLKKCNLNEANYRIDIKNKKEKSGEIMEKEIVDNKQLIKEYINDKRKDAEVKPQLNSTITTVYNTFSKYDKDVIDRTLTKMREDDKFREDLLQIYGINYNTPFKNTKLSHGKYILNKRILDAHIKNEMMKLIEIDKAFRNKASIVINTEVKESAALNCEFGFDLNNIINDLPEDYKKIISLTLGYPTGQLYTYEEIATMLRIDVYEVMFITREVLQIYKNKIINEIDCLIDGVNITR